MGRNVFARRVSPSTVLAQGDRFDTPDDRSLPSCSQSLRLDPLGQYGRSAEFSDPVLAELVRDPAWAPTEGLAATSADGRTATWRPAKLGADGKLEGSARGNSWWFQRWSHVRDEVLLLEAPGAGVIYAGGEPRMGDLYALGIVRAPIALRKGANDVLVRVGRGEPRVVWSRPPAPIYFESFDRTLPDIVTAPDALGVGGFLHAAVLVTNATTDWARGLSIEARVTGAEPHVTELPALAPLEARKVRIGIAPPSDAQGEAVALALALRSPNGDVLHRDSCELAVRRPTQHHTRTFLSGIDDSVQYFAIAPPPRASEKPAALILSLHGASVEARGQAAAYSQKDWCYIVAPTNRRSYGFDWEDWGRRDAIEVLDHVLGEQGRSSVLGVDFDLDRVYLTGHSMGGHGTWQIGARYADRFAAIAPSAGWSDFWSYMRSEGSVPSDPIGAMLHRASNGSRTLLWAPNYAKLGVYVLHGDADDNVPVSEARRMRGELAKFHSDFAYFEQPGASHWWGNECVDWPQLMEFFQHRSIPKRAAATEVALRLVDLDATRSSGFATLIAQTHALEVSELKARAAPAERHFEVQTTNVEAFELCDEVVQGSAFARRWSDWPAREAGRATVDGAQVALPLEGRNAQGGWTLRRAAGEWQLEPAEFRTELHKQPGASGPFKEAFGERVVLVYGTTGAAEETAWALSKARFDADQFRYRGNASPPIVSDIELVAALSSPSSAPSKGPRDAPLHDLGHRHLVLYGNAQTNAAWNAVVESSAFDVQPGRLRLGSRELTGSNLAVLAVRPRTDRPGRLVALVGGTGIAGMRATNHAPYFVSGAGFPDWWVAKAEFLSTGLVEHVGAGFFRADWSVDDGSDTCLREASFGR